MKERMSTKEIPHTDSIAELAQFWDSHDLTDFAEELEEVSEPVFERERSVTIHLSSEEAEAVNRIARSKGIDPADLIHEWVEEKAHGA
jgi:predicted DNA binding CopG/RHH family protein